MNFVVPKALFVVIRSFSAHANELLKREGVLPIVLSEHIRLRMLPKFLVAAVLGVDQSNYFVAGSFSFSLPLSMNRHVRSECNHKA